MVTVAGLSELFGHVSDQVRRTTPTRPRTVDLGAQASCSSPSRRRRLTATPLPAELAEATNSPFAMVRFGIVEELRQRLYGEDLGWLSRLIRPSSSSRMTTVGGVSQAAADALLEMTHRTSPRRWTSACMS
jgi:hypothetical protein